MSTLKVSTISPLGTDSTKTITLGESAGTLAIASGAKTSGFGKIGQVLSTTKTDTFGTSSNSFVDITGFSVTITPSSTSSKIFLTATFNWTGVNGATAAFCQLVRDTTALCNGDASGSRASVTGANIVSDNNVSEQGAASFLDSPSSTSSLTYKMQLKSSASGTVYMNRTSDDSDNSTRARGSSTITVMEILD